MALLTKLSLQDKQRFVLAYSHLKMPLSDLSFAAVFGSDAYLDIKIADINNNLCVFANFEGAHALWGPPLPGNKLESTIDECFEILEAEDRLSGRKSKPTIFYIPEELFSLYDSLSRYEVVPQNKDFVYYTDKLINLNGKALSGKRRMINYFQKHYNYTVELFKSGEHSDSCLLLLEEWARQKSPRVPDNNRYKFESEIITARRAIKSATEIELQGLIVKVDGVVQGFTFGHKLTDEMPYIFIEKTNLKIKGLAQFIYREFVVRVWSSMKYINAGEDWEVEYLAKTKEAYRPDLFIRSFSLRRKNGETI